MDIINEILIRSGNWAHGQMHNITLALVATLLVIYGDQINRFVKRFLRPYPRLIRILGFVIMCAFGYGLLTVLLTPVFAGWFSLVSTKWLGLLVLLAFLVVGWIAESKKQV
ncbi:DUF3392 family protein [Marinospirillum insulare]|uniref:Membrane protein n=1 Tax=Marinospirillum insulare TaxID=217169 RepID=A0ABQ5ZX94_9GAMM|nr:DUF3392 family protein [Marinospirillum insulare]GLR64594.1 membrane protein [Marinospirillum insulare]